MSDFYNFKKIDNFEAYQVPILEENEAAKDFEERCKPLGAWLLDQDAEDVEFHGKFGFVEFLMRGLVWRVRAGDWIVGTDGVPELITDEEFSKYYEKAE